ncbi:tyrosine-type recombinase/integrase [Pannonibacter sp. SL95]|uniref:tyrosine-type recombinase/integrase n=1 Tax=Pannonibacter sp. SL95 TaxID=2995153 RepID=UPI0022726178|nr:site-specific integrase [Pannonibacter sp. SL95]MCY1708344.1 site-specific integrase [Pannonibacter sp. SL95]
MPIKLIKRDRSPYFYMRGSVRGTSVYESTGTSDRKAALEAAKRREAEILKASIHGVGSVMRFSTAIEQYVRDGGEVRFLEPIIRELGECLLKDIDAQRISTAAHKLYSHTKPSSQIRQFYGPVMAVLQHAAKRGLCTVPQITYPKVSKATSRAPRWITKEEAGRLIEAAADHMKPLIIFMLYTGARSGEALYLDWSQVDLDRREVQFVQTKNGEARGVPLHSRVVEALSALKHRTGSVFRTNTGKEYSRPDVLDDWDTSAGTRIKTAFKTAVKRAKVEPFTPHCCRHTWATWHYQANRDLFSLQRLGGWKSLAMVQRYSHVNVGELAHTIDKL